MVVGSALVVDRFSEFLDLAKEKGTVSPQLAAGDLEAPTIFGKESTGKEALLSGGKSSKTVGGGGAFMREFFEAVGEVQADINSGRGGVTAVGALLEEALQATTNAKEQECSKELQRLVQNVNLKLTSAKQRLEALKERADMEAQAKPNAAEQQIRSNMQAALGRKLQTLLTDFGKVQSDYRTALHRRAEAQVHLACPEATEEEVREMVESGDTMAMQVAQKIAGTHALLLDEVERIRDKHRDIQRLERSMGDLHQMFIEMAALVDAQGNIIDSIEVHVHKSAVCTAKAEKELVTTRHLQHSAQRKMCCLSVLVLVILMCILAPVLLQK